MIIRATCITTGGVDKWGRRITLIVGSSIMVDTSLEPYTKKTAS